MSLKPCPHCGAAGKLVERAGEHARNYVVVCEQACDRQRAVGTPYVAEEVWNRRPDSVSDDLRAAADNALGVLIGCCIPAGGVDDRKSILDAQQLLRIALRSAATRGGE